MLEKARSHLETAFPHLHIVGSHSPPFRELTAEEERDGVRRDRPLAAGRHPSLSGHS